MIHRLLPTILKIKSFVQEKKKQSYSELEIRALPGSTSMSSVTKDCHACREKKNFLSITNN